MSLATLRTRLVPILALALFCVAIWLLHGALASVRYQDVMAALSALTRGQVTAAAVLTVLGYLGLTGYDVLALRYIDKSVALRRTLVTSFVASAVGHTLGQSWLTGGSVRYRLYTAFGLSAANVAAVVAFCAFTFWLGFLALGGVVFLLAPPAVPPEVPLPAWTVPAVGAGGLAAALAYLGLGALRRVPLCVGGLAFRVPPWPQRAGQVAVAVVDLLFASATLYVLLPAGVAVSYPAFVGIYLLATVTGIASQVPGGLGVVEGVVVLAAGGEAPASAVVGSLVAFRAIYHLAPLTLAALLLAAVTGWRLRRRDGPAAGSPADLERAAAVVAASPEPSAWLALLGDKSLLWSRSGRAFLMYGAHGGSLVALGDPVGPEAEPAELLFAFRELADRKGASPVFYQVGPHHLPRYVDLGLTVLELGEEARVPLPRGAAGPRGPDGLEARVVPAARVPALLPDLREVSDDWLAAARTGEVGFAFGAFESVYLARCPVAVVRAAGRVVAFANLWLGAARGALAPDLVRARPDAPPGAVDALLAEVLRWGAAQGYRWCHLGMAPLEAAADPTLAPLRGRLGDAGGLRRYLGRFEPVWEPRYLAAHAGLALPAVVADVAALLGRDRGAPSRALAR